VNLYWKKTWMLLCVAGASLLYLRVAIKLHDIQIGGTSRGLTNMITYTRTLPARRGEIYDRNGQNHPLAISAPCWRVFIDPGVIPEDAHAAILRTLAGLDAFDENLVYDAVTSDPSRRYRPIGETLDHEVIRFISTNTLLRRCVGHEDISRRIYPMGRHMSHIVGVVNSHNEPLLGLEKTLDGFLRGKPGIIRGVADARRREIVAKREEKIDPVHGANVYLTLDRNIQYGVGLLLDEAMEETRARAGWIIVQDPATGEILAMASRPDFSPLTFGAAAPTDQWNRAIFVAYEPGSIMKALPFAAGINEGLFATNTLINVDPVLYAGRPLSDYVRGEITLTTAMQKSSNRAASRVAMALGRETMEAYFKAFGFGSRTGIDIEGEATGLLRPARTLSEIGSIRIAIGQGIATTGIQMTALFSTIANGGVRMKPYVIKRIVAADGTILLENTPTPIGRPISAATAADTTFLLTTVIQPGGTGRRAAIPGYTVAGKTGTAQIPVDGRYSTTDYVGSFVGYFPAWDPHVTILVSLEAPKPNYQGGTVAAPLFAKVGALVAEYLEIPPDRPTPSIY